MAGCRSEMFASACQKSMTSVSGDRVSIRSNCRRPSSAIATNLTSGRSCLILLRLRLRASAFSVSLPHLRHADRDRGSSDARPWRRGRKPCRRRPRARRPRHGRPRRPAATMTPSSVHRGADRLVRYALDHGCVQRLESGLPARVHGPCQALQVAHRRRHAADLRKGTPPLPAPCSDPASSADRAEPPAVNRRRVGSRRPCTGDDPLRRYGNARARRSADPSEVMVLGVPPPGTRLHARPARSRDRRRPASRWAKAHKRAVHGLTTRNSASSRTPRCTGPSETAR